MPAIRTSAGVGLSLVNDDEIVVQRLGVVLVQLGRRGLQAVDGLEVVRLLASAERGPERRCQRRRLAVTNKRAPVDAGGRVQAGARRLAGHRAGKRRARKGAEKE